MKEPASTPAYNFPIVPPVVYTRDIVRRHLEDPNHYISDEELRGVKISTDHIDISQHPLMKAFEEKEGKK